MLVLIVVRYTACQPLLSWQNSNDWHSQSGASSRRGSSLKTSDDTGGKHPGGALRVHCESTSEYQTQPEEVDIGHYFVKQRGELRQQGGAVSKELNDSIMQIIINLEDSRVGPGM